MKRTKLRKQRPEAFWGAIASAAGSVLSGLFGAKSAMDQANATADAIKLAADKQAQALMQQNANNNALQQKSQEFIARENERTRQIQRDYQMNLQLQNGAIDSEQRRINSRIQVKRGGKVSRKKLRDIPFYGGGNLPFRVLDGGGVLPLGQTPEGYDLYEIIGNDHDHYHKTQNGKSKTGVGIEFAMPDLDNTFKAARGGIAKRVVEGEGNQNTNQGEYLLVTPDSGMFISKHSINGFNPVEAVNAGMHPLEAYNIQEVSKASSPVKRNRHKAIAGVSTNYLFPTDYPIDVMPIRRQLRKGGRVKAVNGNILGGWITGGGNFLGGALAGLGSYLGGLRGARAYREATPYLTSAYDNLKTVDTSLLKRNMFTGSNYMPVLQSINKGIAPELQSLHNQQRQAMGAIKRNTLSSSAMLNRMTGLNAATNESASRLYGTKYDIEADRRLKNMAASNEAAAKNAEVGIKGSELFASHFMDLLKYNNDIENEKILGKSQALANSIMGQAQARATGNQGLWSNLGTGIATAAGAIGTGYGAAAKEEQSRQNALLIADLNNKVDYYANGHGTPEERAALLNDLNARYEAAISPTDKATFKYYIERLGGATEPKGSLDVQDFIGPMMQFIDGARNYRFKKD